MLGSLFDLFTWQTLMSGLIASAISTIAMFSLNWLKDRSLAEHKEELARESHRLKEEMTQAGNTTLEVLRAGLGRDPETHKLSLKKIELLFDRQVSAASAFMALRRTIDPKKTHPLEEWDEAEHRLASELQKHEQALEEFLIEHGPIMPDEARGALIGCVARISLHRFDYEPGREIERDLSNMIESLLHELAGIELALLRQVRT